MKKKGKKLLRIVVSMILVASQFSASGLTVKVAGEELNPELTGVVAHYPLNSTTQYTDVINPDEALATGSDVAFHNDYVSVVNAGNANNGHIAGDTPASAKVAGDTISFTFDAKLNAVQSRNVYTQNRAMFIYGGKTNYEHDSISIRPYWNREAGKAAVVVRQGNANALVGEFDLPAPGAWHNYSISLDGAVDGKLRLWVDGIKVVEIDALGIGADAIGSQSIRLNRWGMSGNPNLDVHYRDLRIYDQVLSDETVASITGENLAFAFAELLKDSGVGGGNSIRENLPLVLGNGVTWVSDNEAVISSAGVVNRGETNETVTLTVDFRGKTEVFNLEVPKRVEGRELIIDGNVIDIENTFKGFGTVTCNNTSRLLLDYKEEHPVQYWEIMNKLFNPRTGAGLVHVKVELGADVNTSSGTEPATMRYLDEPANVVRGAGFIFANDAKSINPNITTEILRWGEPRFTWNGARTGDYSARYAWYKGTIDAVKAEYGWELDYVGLSQNERAQSNNGKIEADWLVYYLETIKTEPNYETDYKNIKYVAADGYRDTQAIASLMNSNRTVRDGIDVISYHYGLTGSAELNRLQNTLRSEGLPVKELWVSEGVAPMVNSRYRINMESYGGLGGSAGTIDVVQRISAVYSWTGTGSTPLKAVSFDFQPAVAAFYEGSSYTPKHLISAYDPWSGFYEEDSGISGVRQVMNFVNQNNTRWQYLPEATFNDGNHNDGGLAFGSTTHNYLTLRDPVTGDYSTIYTNNSADSRTYAVSAKNLLGKENAALQLWETRGPEANQAYDANWMKHIGTVIPEDDQTYTITVKPYSILTVTTLPADVTTEYQSKEVNLAEDVILELPYTDDFEYSEYGIDGQGRDYIDRRGGTPRYTTDQNGAFEVIKEIKGQNNMNPTSYAARVTLDIPEKEARGNVLQQKTTTSTVGAPWGVWGGTDGEDRDGTSYTWLGDHRWTNYKYSFDALLDTHSTQRSDRKNFVLLGVRQLRSSAGYEAVIYVDGSWELRSRTRVVESGIIDGFDNTQWHNYAVEANENNISFYVNNEKIISYVDPVQTNMSGRVTIGSGYYETMIDNLRVDPIEGISYQSLKIDSAQGAIYFDLNTDEESVIAGLTDLNPMAYVGAWTYKQSGYAHFNRTLTENVTNSPVWNGTTISFSDSTTTQGTLNQVYYQGTWQQNASRAWSISEGASFEITFKGVDAKIYGVFEQTSGSADVYLNGEKMETVQYLNNSEIPGVIWSTEGLEYEEHTIRIVATTGSINFTKGEFTSTAATGYIRNIAPNVLTHIKEDSEVGTAENTVYAYRRSVSNWGSQASNAWANFGDDPYLLINFTGTGIDFRANTGATAYNFELNGVDVGNHGPGNGVIYSVHGLEEKAHTLKVSLGNNTANDTFMDYRGVSIYYTPTEIQEPSYFVFKFEGTGFNLFGNTAAALLRVTIDGEVVDTAGRVGATGDRLHSYVLSGLENKEHIAKIEVIGGSFQLDGIDITGVDAKSDIPVDKTELQALYDENKDKAEADYTDESWPAFADALQAAEEILANGQATQGEVDNAKIDLQTAIEGLEEKIHEIEADSIALSVTGIKTLKRGQTLQVASTMEPTNATSAISWEINNETIASINENGVITALRVGTVSVTARTSNGKRASFTLRVTN